jgi:CRISPR/Cas system CMR subunit Cmr4 (Cas7 group RAMP superfamily)
MIVRVDYTAIAVSPLHHGGNEKTGNLSMLRRLPFLVGEEIVEIPYIDGNAVRGRLRRLAPETCWSDWNTSHALTCSTTCSCPVARWKMQAKDQAR